MSWFPMAIRIDWLSGRKTKAGRELLMIRSPSDFSKRRLASSNRFFEFAGFVVVLVHFLKAVAF